MATSPESIATLFDVPGRLVTLETIGSGNVNDTFIAIFRTTFSEHRIILQRINNKVFPEPAKVMGNLKRITEHAHPKIEAAAQSEDRIWQLPRLVPARDGGDFVLGDTGDTWRALSHIASATAFDTVRDPAHAREAGIVLGHFQELLSDLDTEVLEDPLPGFHIAPQYLAQYDRVLPEDLARTRLEGSPDAREIARFIEARREFIPVLENALDRGELEHCPIHGDPKISNIMIDDLTGKGTCIIDLDTVKPGLVHYDFGDAVRSTCNPAGEETTDLNDVGLDLQLFRALVEGYLSRAGKFLSGEDHRYLYDSTRLLTLELGLRFFADYLAGDVYFKTSYPAQNLNRARVQMRLCEKIEEAEGAMRKILG